MNEQQTFQPQPMTEREHDLLRTLRTQKLLRQEVSSRTKDFYLEWGCCIGCDETRKEGIRGLRRQVWYKGKPYHCLCSDCKCGGCTWLYDGGCQRKQFDDYGLAT